MTVGDGIFGAALVFAVVALFIAAKDSWNWRKPVLYSLVFCSLIGLGIWGWTIYRDRPGVQTIFWNIALGDTMGDVRFRKGTPIALRDGISDDDVTYMYREDERTEVWVRFWNQRVQAVTMFSNEDLLHDIQGIYFGSSTHALVERFGRLVEMHESRDGLTRIYSFPKYQLFFALARDKVDAMGVYNPAHGLPISFKGEELRRPDDRK